MGLKDLITMDYSKLLTPNLCGYSVSGLSGMDSFKEHSPLEIDDDLVGILWRCSAIYATAR